MAEMDNQSLMQFLIDNGADVNAKNFYGLTPLHCAVIHRNRCVIDILIQAGADINAKSCLKRTALHFAISNYQHKQWKRILPSQGDGPDMWMFEKLLEQQNIRVNVKDIRGDTPLMWAVMDKQVDIVLALLRKDANPNIRSKDSLTPLHVAMSAEDPCPYIVVTLLFHKASLNIADKEGNTPIDILIRNVRNTQSYEFAYTFLETIAFTHRIKQYQKRKLESIPQLSAFLERCCVEIMLMKLDNVTNGLSVFYFMLLGHNDSDFENSLLQVYVPIVKRLLRGLYPQYLYYILEHIPKSILCVIFEIIFKMDCEEISDTETCDETSDVYGCDETSDVDGEMSTDYDCKTFVNDGCEETSCKGCQETSCKGCQETSCKGCEETSCKGCEEISYIDGSVATLDNDGCEDASYTEGCEGVVECINGNPRDFFLKIDFFILSRYLSRLDVFCLIVALSEGKIPECMRQVRNRKFK